MSAVLDRRTATPTGARQDRIRRLRELIARAEDELRALESTEHRVRALPQRVEPSAACGTTIRQWALRNGHLQTVTRGRVSNELRILYAAAGEPDGQ